MEFQNQLTPCPNGHYYNAALHAKCPICNESAAASMPPTEPFSSAPGSVTQPIDAAPTMGSGNFGQTEPPFADSRVPSDHSPFTYTSIGGDMGPEGGIAPVVGWLVCIEGPMRGNDYRLHAGYNYIGRESGDIRLTNDQQISRQNHAMIAFDDADNIYYAGPSAGRNLIKVNGKTVINAVELNNHDILSIGTTKLMFVALCGEQFSWKKV